MRNKKETKLLVATDPTPEQILRAILTSVQEIRGITVNVSLYSEEGEDDQIEVGLVTQKNDGSISRFSRGKGETITHAISELCQELTRFGELDVDGRHYVWDKAEKRFVRNDKHPDEIRRRADDLVRQAEQLRQLADKISSQPAEEKKPSVIDLSIPAGAKERRELERIKLFLTDFNTPLPNPPFEPKRCRKIVYCIVRACYERFDGRPDGSWGLNLDFSGNSASISGGFIPEPYATRILSACGLTKESASKLVGRFCWVASNSDESGYGGSRHFLEPLLNPQEIKNLPKELTYRG